MTHPGPAELQSFLDAAFPRGAGQLEVRQAAPNHAVVALQTAEQHLRPGNTTSGPTLMMLADTAAYLAILATVGLEALAVTTHLSIDFLRKTPADSEVEARAELVKLGRRLAVAAVRVSAGDQLVATASVTYSRPRPESGPP